MACGLVLYGMVMVAVMRRELGLGAWNAVIDATFCFLGKEKNMSKLEGKNSSLDQGWDAIGLSVAAPA